MVRLRVTRLVFLSLGIGAMIAACGTSTGSSPEDAGSEAGHETGSACVPGQQINCGCPGGSIGVQVCSSGGTMYGACACGGEEAGSDATTRDAGLSDTGTDAAVDGGEGNSDANDGGCPPNVTDSGVGGSLNWADRFGLAGTTTTNGTGVAVDPSTGLVAMTGAFGGSTNLGGGVIMGGDAGGAGFVAAFDSAGSYKWAQVFASAAAMEGVALTPSHNILLSGSLSGTADFGGGTVTSTSSIGDALMALYSPTGGYLWSEHFGVGSTGGAFYKAAFDGTGNIYVVGNVIGAGPVSSWGQLDLGCGALPSGSIVFVAKFDSTGACLWSKAPSVTDSTIMRRVVAVDPVGNVLIGSGFYGSIDFGNGPLTATGIGMDAYIAKFSSAGTLLWAKAYGNGGSVGEVTGIAADACGNAVVDGTFSGTFDFGCGSLTESGGTGAGNIFLAKLDPSGNCIWSNGFGNDASGEGQLGGPLALDSLGGPVITGTFAGTVNFGGGIFTGGSDLTGAMYIAKFNSAGTYQWAYWGGPPASNAENSGGLGIASNSTAIVTMGQFQDGTLDLAGDSLTAVSELDTYLASFAP